MTTPTWLGRYLHLGILSNLVTKAYEADPYLLEDLEAEIALYTLRSFRSIVFKEGDDQLALWDDPANSVVAQKLVGPFTCLGLNTERWLKTLTCSEDSLRRYIILGRAASKMKYGRLSVMDPYSRLGLVLCVMETIGGIPDYLISEEFNDPELARGLREVNNSLVLSGTSQPYNELNKLGVQLYRQFDGEQIWNDDSGWRNKTKVAMGLAAFYILICTIRRYPNIDKKLSRLLWGNTTTMNGELVRALQLVF